MSGRLSSGVICGLHVVTRIKVMHDYACSPLWVTRDGHDLPSNESPTVLGLSSDLVGRLDAWRRWGDSHLNLADPHDSRVVSAEESDAFDAEGRQLADRISAELTDADVGYWKDLPAT